MWLRLLRRLNWRGLLLLCWALHYLNSVRRVRLHLAKTTLCDARKALDICSLYIYVIDIYRYICIIYICIIYVLHAY